MLGTWSTASRPSAWGLAPAAVLAVVEAGISTIGAGVSTGVNIAQQIQTGRQARELTAYQAAQDARARALQLRAAEAAQAQQAALNASRVALVGKLVPVALVALVGVGLLLALRPPKPRR